MVDYITVSFLIQYMKKRNGLKLLETVLELAALTIMLIWIVVGLIIMIL